MREQCGKDGKYPETQPEGVSYVSKSVSDEGGTTVSVVLESVVLQKMEKHIYRSYLAPTVGARKGARLRSFGDFGYDG